jgi:hypothetical protein
VTQHTLPTAGRFPRLLLRTTGLAFVGSAWRQLVSTTFIVILITTFGVNIEYE